MHFNSVIECMCMRLFLFFISFVLLLPMLQTSNMHEWKKMIKFDNHDSSVKLRIYVCMVDLVFKPSQHNA